MPILVDVRVIPRAKKTELAGRRGAALVIRLAAPPVDGAANEALVAWLAGQLGVPRRQVAIARGASSRDKVIAIDGLTRAEVASRLGVELAER